MMNETGKTNTTVTEDVLAHVNSVLDMATKIDEALQEKNEYLYGEQTAGGKEEEHDTFGLFSKIHYNIYVIENVLRKAHNFIERL